MQKRGVSIAFAFGSVLFLSGCVGNGTSVDVNGDGVNVKTPGVSVQTSSEGVNVNAGGGTSVQTGQNGVNVNTGSAMVQTGGGGTATSEGSQQESNDSSKNVVLIMDASGSMNAVLGGEKKIDIAKRSAGMYIDSLASGTNLSIVTYGHIGSSSVADKAKSCAGIEEIYYFGTVNAFLAKSKVNALPALGWTPIAKSLEKGRGILSTKAGGNKEILLVSDGQETCGGDPVAIAKSICSMGIRVDVIGFNVSGADEQQLQNIARQCGGYASVNSESEFKTVIQSGNLQVVTPGASVKIQGGKLEVLTNDAQVQTGSDGLKVNTNAVDVKTGSGGVKVNVPNVPGF